MSQPDKSLALRQASEFIKREFSAGHSINAAEIARRFHLEIRDIGQIVHALTENMETPQIAASADTPPNLTATTPREQQMTGWDRPPDEPPLEMSQSELFDQLKVQFEATAFSSDSPDSRLFGILKRMSEKKFLAQEQINWLEQQNLWRTLMHYYLMCYTQSGKLSNAVSAAIAARKGKNPQRALTIADTALHRSRNQNPSDRVPLLLTQGWTRIQLRQYAAAEISAREALKTDPKNSNATELLNAAQKLGKGQKRYRRNRYEYDSDEYSERNMTSDDIDTMVEAFGRRFSEGYMMDDE
ncbi:MAG: hypothetical protein K8L91_04200 [Anaerolineae bacterium]|nr:hypothetical protein [Anaerolineae bacterium]